MLLTLFKLKLILNSIIYTAITTQEPRIFMPRIFFHEN